VTARLAGRAALVTGASAGIGRACALALAREGARVVATGRRREALDEVVAACRALGGEATAVAGDLDAPGFARSLAAQAGDCDILVNNAGILTYAPLLDTRMEDCEAMFRTNVVAAFEIALEMARRMAARRSGHIVFVTSGAARNVNMHATVYAATKHALSAFAKGFRLELKSSGIAVSEVAPGMVDTGIRDRSTHPEVLKSIAARRYRPLSAEDVATGVLYALTAPEGCSADLLELRPREA
jgi:3-oxoacyl-[acyl-carrier protein] reductase